MLHNQSYQTNSLMRCKYLSFVIPLSSILTLFLIISSIFVLPWCNDNAVYAVEGISPLTDTPSASLSIANPTLSNAGKAGELVTMSSNVSVNAILINSYNLQISGNPVLEGPSTINATSTVATAEELGNDTWGYSWNNGSYKGINTSNATIANDGVSSTGSVSYTRPLTFAAKFSQDAEAGHYKTKVNLLLTATPKTLVTYTLSYNGNGSGASSIPSAQSISNYDDSYTFSINTTKPTRSGYEFAGYATTSTGSVAYQPGGSITLQASSPSQTLYAKWNQIYTRTLSFNANNGSGAPGSRSCSSTSTSCSVTIPSTKPTRSGYTFLGWGTSSSSSSASYQPNGSITLSGNKTLYAVWKINDPWASITTMQQMTSSACAAASTGKSKTLTDSRDNSSYTVRKMADGKCWMTQNLRLMGSRTLKSSDSNVTSDYTLPASSTSGFSSDTASNAYLSGNTGYYTWCAATAGTCSSATSNGANATSSICPKGWKLPTGTVVGKNTTNDFWNLFRNMGLTISNDSLAAGHSGSTNWGTGDLAKVQGSPYNFAYTGYMFTGSGPQYATSQGSWWSRTAYNSTNAYALYFDSSNVYPGTAGAGRQSGFAVRCVAQ